jgi:hypothetical protein
MHQATIHQNEIKKGRHKEENFSQENCLPKGFIKNKNPKRNLRRLIPT